MKFAASIFAAPTDPGRRRVLGGMLGGGLAAALALPVGARAQAVGGRVLRLGFIGAGKPVGPSGWAHEQGLLLRELAPLGYADIRTHAFPNGPDLNEALIAGALDVGVYGDTPAIVARARGLAGRLLSFENVGLNTFLVTPRGGVRTVEELEGKVVATQLGSYMHRYLIGRLKAAGILRTTKVVYMLGRDAEPALARGDIAAFAAQSEIGAALALKGYPVVDESRLHPQLRGTLVAVAADQTLAATPGLAGAWRRARQAAVRQIRDGGEAYYDFHARRSGFSAEVVKAAYALSQFHEQSYPVEGLELLASTKDFLVAERLAATDIDLAAWRLPEEAA